MKYIVTVRVTHEFCIEVTAKDDEKALQKAESAWEKVFPLQFDGSQLGDFEHIDEEVEFDAEEY